MRLLSAVARLFNNRREGRSTALVDAAFQALEAGNVDEARRLAERLQSMKPDDPRALHLCGVVRLHEGRSAEASVFIERALAIDSGHAEQWYDLGEAYRLHSSPVGAARAYRKAVELRPDFAAARQALVSCLLQQGELEAAEGLLESVDESNDAALLETAAFVAMERKDMRRAERRLGKALALAPDRGTLHVGLGGTLLEQGRVYEAFMSFQQALRCDPTLEKAHQGMVMALERQVLAGRLPYESCALAPAEDKPRPFFSVVICSIDEVKFERVTAMYRALLTGERYEIVGIHDAKSLCEGYNRGVRAARGDVVIFSHDDIEILAPDFARRLAAHTARHHLVGLCGTTRLTDGYWMNAGWPYLRGLVAHHYPDTGRYRVLVLDCEFEVSRRVQALDGLFLAARRDVREQVRFEEETCDGFHLYDLDFSFTAHQLGFDVVVCHDIPVIHYTYADGPGYIDAYGEYRSRFEKKHAGRLKPVARGNTRFLQALFDDKEQVRSFYGALLAARKRLALERRQSGRT